MRRDDPRHGTWAGAQVHRKEGKRPCAACREAANNYMRQHRAKTGNTVGKAYGRARTRATRRLIDRHREEFAALLAEEWKPE